MIEHQGIAFVIIAFTHLNEVYLVNASYVIDAYYQPDQKSISYQTVKEKGHLIEQGFNPRLDYLKIIDQYYLGGHENDKIALQEKEKQRKKLNWKKSLHL